MERDGFGPWDKAIVRIVLEGDWVFETKPLDIHFADVLMNNLPELLQRPVRATLRKVER